MLCTDRIMSVLWFSWLEQPVSDNGTLKILNCNNVYTLIFATISDHCRDHSFSEYIQTSSCRLRLLPVHCHCLMSDIPADCADVLPTGVEYVECLDEANINKVFLKCFVTLMGWFNRVYSLADVLGFILLLFQHCVYKIKCIYPNIFPTSTTVVWIICNIIINWALA